jgi:SCP-2 sterol transfer family
LFLFAGSTRNAHHQVSHLGDHSRPAPPPGPRRDLQPDGRPRRALQVGDLDAVFHFKILDRPADQRCGYDHYEVIFADVTCRASNSPERDPKVTIKVSGVEFLKLAANKASGPTLFLTGKLKLEGDVMLASRLTSFFRIPSAG